MFGIVDYPALFLGVAAPKHKNYGVGTFVEQGDHKVGKPLPALACVRTAGSGADGEDGVEQENTLLRPAAEVAAVGGRYAQVVFERFVDIHERRGTFNALSHRKAHSVRLAFAYVGVLPDYDHLDIFVRGVRERAEYIALGRIYGVRDVFPVEEVAQFVEIFAVEFAF